MDEEEYLIERRKKYLLIGGVSIFSLILVFGLIKFVALKLRQPPPSTPTILTPGEVMTEYFSLELNQDRGESEKYLFSDFSKVEIWGENYQNLRTSLWKQSENKDGLLPEYKILKIDIKGNTARISTEVLTNKMEDSLFFNFRLPEKINFEIDFLKEDDDWKILKINSPDLILEREFGEKVEIRENVFIRPIRIGNYQVENTEPFEKGVKFFFLEIEFENKSTASVNFSSFNEWQIVDENGNFYYSRAEPSLPLKDILLPDIEVNPGEIEKVSVFFETYNDFSQNKVIFQNSDKKVIFSID